MEIGEEDMDSKMLKALDCAIRDYETKGDIAQYGYKIENKIYENYMSNKTWKSFKEDMRKNYRDEFEKGGGKELEERKTRYGLYPPKMACYGSSSRLIYLYSKNIEAFSFERQLPTIVGGYANLDGYKHNESLDVYVEAKCREIYYSHSSINVSNKYINVYDFIRDKMEMNLVFECDYQNEKDCCGVFKYKGEKIKHFDVKQLICHFLGISAHMLNPKFNHNNTKIKFVYFIYNPKELENLIDEKHRDKILETYKKTIDEIKIIINNKGMELLFNAVYEFQKQNMSNQHLPLAHDSVPSFEFILTDQDEYKNAIEKV